MSQDIARGMTQISVTQLRCAKLQQLIAFWDELRQSRAAPSRQDFVPEQLDFILGRVNLVEVLGEEQNFRFRLVGTQIEDGGRRGDQGRTLDRIELAVYGDMLAAAYREVLQACKPVCRRVEYKIRDTDVWFEQVTLPFTQAGSEIELLLEGIDWPLGMVQNFHNLAHVERQLQAC